MSFGFSVGDIITVSKFAFKIYRACKDSATDFQTISGEVISLHIVLKETKHLTAECGKLDAEREADLVQIGNGCREVLEDLESHLARYDRLGTQQQRTWDWMRFGLDDISEIRARLISHTGMLTALNTIISW